jgi:hypothetical protein
MARIKRLADIIPMGKHIAYNSATREYVAYYDSSFVTVAASYFEAEEKLNAHVYALLQFGQVLVGELTEEVQP